MAGIGFELRKIFGKKTLMSGTWGVVYASMTTIGPSIMFILLLFMLRALMRWYHAGEQEMLFFTASFTYVFLLAILTSALLNTVVSRYISDKIFQKKEADISASLLGVLTIGTIAAGMEAGVICVLLHRHDHVSLIFMLAYFLLLVFSTNSYHLMIYVSAIKEYKKVTLSYLAGMIVTLPVFFLLYKIVGWHLILSVFWALVCGFFVINLLLFCWCIKAFGKPSRKIFEYLKYFVKYPKLLLSGFSYMLGFYISNVIYWFFSDMKACVSIFFVAPNYDLAMFLALLVNLSGMVVFEVKTETLFYERYVSYLSALEQGTYDRIEKERVSMQNTINLQLFFVYEVQLIITVILICLVNIFYPYLGIASQILNLFMLLGMGVYCTFCMYFTVIFLYYFEDHTAACIGPVVFLVIVLTGSLICCRLGNPYYPIPLLLGAVAGWIISFVLLRRRLKHLNSHLLCR
ncbi:MAG: exopolysaccharide Pel transporter PelG [Lachnospiraceae bacterium]|nr:exopolysaccharide Pel transporter PelG [Lachnospiraceae bacterium]